MLSRTVAIIQFKIRHNHEYLCIRSRIYTLYKSLIRYFTIETKEVACNGYNGFLFPHEYSDEGRARKKKPVISHVENFFCFNSNVSNLYNNDVKYIKDLYTIQILEYMYIK